MKKNVFFKASLFFAVVAIIGLLRAPISYAQTEKTNAEKINEAFQKSEEAKKLRQEVSLLKEVFGIETEDKDKSSKNNSTGGRTMTNVADDALQLTKSLVVSISETLQKVAPNVWWIMIKQQYVKAVYGVLIPWGIFLIFFVYFRVIQKRWTIDNNTSEDEKNCRIAFATVIPVLVCIGSGIMGVINIAGAFKYLINPQFYAIRDLLVMLLGSGS